MSFIYQSRGRSDHPRRVFLAVPVGDGKPFTNTVSCLSHAEMALHEAGWGMELAIEANNCHVDDTRNSLVREFLKSSCTDLVFIDADVGWRDDELIKLLSYDRDIVAGVYPKKTDKTEFPVFLKRGELRAEADGLLEVERVPTGFLRIRRGVLEALAEKAAKFSSNEHKAGDPPYPLIFERMNNTTDGRRWSGDYAFCNKAKALGFRIFVDPEMHFSHSGVKAWTGCLGDHLRDLAGIDHPRFVAAIESIRAEGATAENLMALYTYAHNAWAASPEMLFAAYRFASEATGPILECGSGLTTIVMGLAAERSGVPVYTLEHDLDWVRKMRPRLAGLSKVELIYAPLEEYPGYVWYQVPLAIETKKFALVVCDGPPRKYGREGLFCLLGKQVAGAHWLIDDTDDLSVLALIKKYGAGRVLHPLQPEDGARPFGILPARKILPQPMRASA